MHVTYTDGSQTVHDAAAQAGRALHERTQAAQTQRTQAAQTQ